VSLRLLMMGTGGFALPTFLRLCDSSHDVVGLVTQPDRTGRGHHHHVNVLKAAAAERNIPVFQPVSANDAEAIARLRDFDADLFVVAAYGQLLSAALLGLPCLGAINVHASLLPKFRGAAPVVYAILQGETETGVSIFQIEPRLDAGPVLGIVSTPIDPKETAGELEARLSQLAPPLVLEVIERIERGTAQAVAQDPLLVSRAPRLRKEQGAIDWSQPAQAIDRHIRAMHPWPKPFTFLHSAGHPPLRLLVLDVDPVAFNGEAAAAGQLTVTDEQQLLVRTGQGVVQINNLQPAGKRPMSAAEFLRGHDVRTGDYLGPETSETC
jgi:methionyl-tRNA formyltransferase